MGGVVYFIRDGERAFKIGYTSDVEHRLASLRTITGKDLILDGHVNGDRQFERHLHGLLFDIRIKGEWFSFCDKSRDVLAQVMRGEKLGFVPSPSADVSKFVFAASKAAEFVKRCGLFIGLEAPENISMTRDPYLEKFGVTSQTVWKFCYRPTEPLTGEYFGLLKAVHVSADLMRDELQELQSFSSEILEEVDASRARINALEKRIEELASSDPMAAENALGEDVA